MQRGMGQMVNVELRGPDGQTRSVRLPLALVARMMLSQGGDDDDE